MRLDPIAKPIRIRIKLGNSEYSNLESVKNNFSIEELYPLFKDGRLERWLIQIGENLLANKVKEMAPKCSDGNIRDYILFLSLFFDEISSFDKNEETWSINDYFNSTPLQTWSIIYGYTNHISHIDWKTNLRNILTKNNIKEIFEDRYLHSIFSNSEEWGHNFAHIIESEEDYKSIFSYLEKESRRSLESSSVLIDFVSLAKAEGYEWEKIYADELTLDYAIGLYKNPSCQSIGIEWGIIFANLIENWEKENERVENVISSNSNHLTAFYQHCVERGFNEANGKLDPWYLLANSDEKDIICQALKEWDGMYGHYDRNNYNYSTLKNKLSIQILDFLQNLIDLRGQYGRWYHCSSEDSDYYLSQEKEIVIALSERWRDSYREFHFKKETLNQLQEMSRTNGFAKYVLNHTFDSYLDIAKYLVKKVFLSRLTPEYDKNDTINTEKTFIDISDKAPNSLIEVFLSDPEHFSSTEYSDLGRFLYALSTICSIKNSRSVYSEAKGALSGVSDIYRNEKKYILAIAHFFESRNNISILKQDLHDWKSSYPPAEYLWIWYHKSVRRDNIVRTHIEDFSTLKQHICYVVQHLEDKKFV